MSIGQPGEERLLHDLVVEEEAEVGVVADGHDVASTFGRRDQDVPDGVGLGGGDGIPGRVVREVEEHDELAPARVLGDRPAEALHVETLCQVEQGIAASLRAPLHCEDQEVVAPELVRQKKEVSFVDEHVGDRAEPVSDPAGDDRQADGDVAQRRVLLP